MQSCHLARLQLRKIDTIEKQKLPELFLLECGGSRKPWRKHG